MLVFFEHNPYNPATRYSVSRCPLDDGVKLLPPHYLKNIFQGNRIAGVEMDYILFFPKPISSLKYLEKCLKRVPLGGQYVVYGKK
jgi:hypothetical protein